MWECYHYVKKLLRGTLKATVYTLCGLVLVTVLAVCAVYIPAVQDYAIPRVLKMVSTADMQITAERIRVRFPLEVTVDSLRLHTADMTLVVGHGELSPRIAPLLERRVSVPRLPLRDSYFHLHMQEDTVQKAPSAPLGWIIEVDRASLREVGYEMEMPPTIARIKCQIGKGELKGLRVDLRTDSVKVALEHCELRHSEALYAAVLPAPETPNFDPSYIQGSEVSLTVDSLYNCLSELRLPIRRFSARERCGVAVEITGLLTMDAEEMRLEGMRLTTPTSAVNVTAAMGLGADMATAPLEVALGAEISAEDLRRLAPSGVAAIVDMLPQRAPLEVVADLRGTFGDLDVQALKASMPGYFAIGAKGAISRMDSLNLASGHVDLAGSVRDGAFVTASVLDAKMRRQVRIPPLTVKGRVEMDRGDIDGTLAVSTHQGELLLDAAWDNRHSGYYVELTADHFPVQSIMPEMGLEDLSASVKAEGMGFDPFASGTWAEFDLTLQHAQYRGYTLTDATVGASLREGRATATLQSHNRPASLTLSAEGNLDAPPYRWDLKGDIRNLDLKALGLSAEESEGAGSFTAGIEVTTERAIRSGRKLPRIENATATLDVASLYWRLPLSTVNATDVSLCGATDSAKTTLSLENHDLRARMELFTPLDSVMARLDQAMALLGEAMTRHHAAIDSLQQAMPRFALKAEAGPENFVSNYLQGSDITFDRLAMECSNDTAINADVKMEGLVSGTLRIDTITGALRQVGPLLNFDFSADNAPGTLDQFAHIQARGNLSSQRLVLYASQQNIQGDTGYSLGGMITANDSSTLTLHFVPYHPVIAYKEWEVNPDNHITYNLRTHNIQADLNLHNELSSIRLFTEPSVGGNVVTAGNAGDGEGPSPRRYDDLVVQLSNIKLSDWVTLNPFAPPITGDLGADVRLCYQQPNINGTGHVSLADLAYGKRRVGSFDVNFDVATNPSGSVRARGTLDVDSREVMTLTGTLNDTVATSPLTMDLKVDRLPLHIVNPFLPPQTASAGGYLSGQMEVGGTFGAPRLDGYVAFDSAQVMVDMLGTPFRFSQERVTVDSNSVSFRDFAIIGCNNKPLTVNGTVDLSSFVSPKIDLDFQARNMQVVGSQQSRRSQVYGKAFVNVGATARGSLSFLNVDATLELLPETNVTYVMANATQVLTSRSNQNMVKFVNFADTTAVEHADTVAAPSMLMNLDAQLIIDPGSTVSIDLSTDGRNKVKLLSSGTLNYSQDYMGDEHFTGRLNINSGFVRYTPPLMSEKLFNFEEGSYVAFNGEMLNPILNVHAVDQVKSSVSTNGNSRLVTFDVGLNITGTLDQINAAFDLGCNNDVTIQNELQSMSPEQRANQAMNILLYGAYSGGSSHSLTGNGSNALYSFLEGQLNSWASQAIKGVDISFGISQFDTTTDGVNSSAMNYSYQVSKSLFNDRFKIVVGGNYTTDARADEDLAQNLLSDVSFEYMLNRAGTMYIRLFRHTGYESILEGEITKTGVGFVYKRKIQRLGDLFRFGHH